MISHEGAVNACYNENDEFAADWLENLVAAGHIAPGFVDRRSILDLTPDDLLRYGQVHLFAGIGIWSASMRDAGIRDDDPWWSASCPCQPFSQAGQGKGFADERHLWPAAFHLISECRPAKIVGEQVASPDGLHWIDLVSADLEGADYAFGASDLCAAGVAVSAAETGLGQATIEWVRGAIQSCPDPVLAAELRDYAEWLGGAVGFGAPHIRQRLYWMAHAACEQHEGCGSASPRGRIEFADCGAVGTLADADSQRCDRVDACLPGARLAENSIEATRRGETGELGHTDDSRSQGRRGMSERGDQCAARAHGVARELADSEIKRWRQVESDGSQRHSGTCAEGWPAGFAVRSGADPVGDKRIDGFWSDAGWIYCRDGKWRPVELGTFPLAHGERSRVGKLRAYGNQLVRPLARAFLEAAREAVAT